jgi:mRNA interferase MazF
MGGEIQKTRPAVVVSNDAANAALSRTLVVPLSSQIQRVYPSETLVTLNGEIRKAMADQLTTARKLRFRSRLGALSSEDMARIEDVLLLQLSIKR